MHGIPIDDGRFLARQPPFFPGFTLEVEGTFKGSTVGRSTSVSNESGREASADYTASRE